MIDPNHVLRVGAATDLYVEQLQAKVAELEADLEFQTNARIQDRKDAETNYKNWNAELKKQLVAAQEEIQRMKRERLLTADAIESMHASHKDQLTNAEQRVAEACIALIEDRLGELDGQDSEWAAGQVGAIGEIADGGWRKFVKEV